MQTPPRPLEFVNVSMVRGVELRQRMWRHKSGLLFDVELAAVLYEIECGQGTSLKYTKLSNF